MADSIARGSPGGKPAVGAVALRGAGDASPEGNSAATAGAELSHVAAGAEEAR